MKNKLHFVLQVCKLGGVVDQIFQTNLTGVDKTLFYHEKLQLQNVLHRLMKLKVTNKNDLEIQ